ncbi:oxidoreductase [Sporanaerobium hydrogeniformans]|uniref:Oxidoreductase n=1 Tax=Sporanaerobium hydrogeniformans TaxID=3072179 RepID=A0AC61D779_9FIRM|nr:Gfo/Idh/MocA family oxidoreductase [Sporanaerobium hydrogeniformans]PHV69344.1 oxidoreductase [Sporanaerobium hydrogeniformans]
MGKVLSYGMVGGGPDAFIGDAHRRAIALDGKAKLVAGCFSRSYPKTLETGKLLGVEVDRLYEDYEQMAKAEAAREDGINFVVIVTPNYAHFAACKAFLEAGIAVSCDKPLAVSLDEAEELERIAREKNLLFMVTYVYSGHVTAMHIREMIKAGEIGDIRMIMGEYPQGWLAFEDISGNKQGEWRTDPALSGKSNALGDIGTHIENTVYRMTGLKIKRVLAKMDIIVPNRRLDDNSVVLVEYENGASGSYWASQIAIGHDNGLRIRIYGSEGSISWFQEQPENIELAKADGTLIQVHRGHGAIKPVAAKYTRLPSGHGEGWFEAMANLYSNFIDCLIAKEEGTFDKNMIEYPTVEDGVDGVRFVEACIESTEKGNAWVEF